MRLSPLAAHRSGLHAARLLCIVLLATQLGGCTKEGEPPAEPAGDAQPPPAGDSPAMVEQKKQVATRPPSPDDATGQMVNEAIVRVQEQPSKLDFWVLLGEAWAQYARAHADEEAWVFADAAADVALSIKPGYGPARDLKGLALLSGHRFDDARALAESILANRPDDAVALGVLSDAKLELGDYAGAVAAADKMMEVKPNLPSYSRVAWLQWLAGDVEQAKASWKLAFDAGRGAPNKEPPSWVLTEAAMLFWHQGDYEGAEAGADLVLKYNPGFPPALVVKGRARLARGDAPAAAKLFAAALDARPKVATAALLGDAHTIAGDTDAAANAYARARALGQHDRLALSRWLSMREDTPDEALRLAKREARSRGSQEVKTALAFAQLGAGQTEDALVTITDVRKLDTRDASLIYIEGRIKLAAGQDGAGRDLLKEALELNPSFDVVGATRARALLDQP